jgi:hypothetical protein
MRIAAVIAAALLAGTASASQPFSNELRLPLGGVSVVRPDVSPASAVPQVTRGQYLGVACANIDRVARETVRVVMYLAKNEPPAGMRGVLATDQTITPGTIHVRVPDIAELADHTVFVRVYYLDGGSRHTCDAGNIHIL